MTSAKRSDGTITANFEAITPPKPESVKLSVRAWQSGAKEISVSVSSSTGKWPWTGYSQIEVYLELGSQRFIHKCGLGKSSFTMSREEHGELKFVGTYPSSGTNNVIIECGIGFPAEW